VINVNTPHGENQRMFHKSKAQMLQNYKNTDKAIEIGAMYTLNK